MAKFLVESAGLEGTEGGVGVGIEIRSFSHGRRRVGNDSFVAVIRSR